MLAVNSRVPVEVKALSIVGEEIVVQFEETK